MSYYNESGQPFDPVFSRVYSPYVTGDLAVESTLDSIPIDLSRDSTILVFEIEDRIDTLAFSYKRELNVGSKRKGYCIEIYNPHVSESTTFQNAIVFLDIVRYYNFRNLNTCEIYY